MPKEGGRSKDFRFSVEGFVEKLALIELNAYAIVIKRCLLV